MIKHISKTPFPENKLAQEREIRCTEYLLWARMRTMHIFLFISSSKQAYIIKGNCEGWRGSTACLGPQVIKDRAKIWIQFIGSHLLPVWFPFTSESHQPAWNSIDWSLSGCLSRPQLQLPVPSVLMLVPVAHCKYSTWLLCLLRLWSPTWQKPGIQLWCVPWTWENRGAWAELPPVGEAPLGS